MSDKKPSAREITLGKPIRGKVTRSQRHQAEVALMSVGLRGYIRADEIEWGKRCDDVSAVLKEGEEYDFVPIRRRAENHRIVLSRRCLEHDPWDDVSQRYPVGKLAQGRVVLAFPQGVIVKLEDGVEGSIALEDIVPWKMARASEVLWWGDRVEAIVEEVGREERMLRLNMRKRLEALEKEIADAIARPEGDVSLSGTVESERAAEVVPLESTQHVRYRVLLADDDSMILSGVGLALQTAGYEVIRASGAEEATEKAVELAPDILVLDVKLPSGHEGLEVAERVREQREDVPVILITGADSLDSAIREANNRGLSFSVGLGKPFASEELLEVIDDVLHGRVTAAPEPRASRSPDARFLQAFSKTVHTQAITPRAVAEALEQLVSETEADAAGIYALNATTYSARLVAHYGLDEGLFEAGRDRIRYSPVRDVIMDDEHINSASPGLARRPKYRYLTRTLPRRFDACLARALSAGTREEGFCLFVFRWRPEAFSEPEVGKAELALHVLSPIIQALEWQRAIEKDKQFAVLGQISAGAAHEMRSIVTALGGWLSALDGDLPSGVDQREVLAEARHATDRLRQVVGALLDLTGAEESCDTDLNQVVLEAADLMRPFAREQHIRIMHIPEPDLPRLWCVPVRIRQICTNLILNAAEMNHLTQRKHGLVILSTRYDKSKRKFVITVRDTGPGIHERHLELIFEPSFTTKPEGAGLGLAISRGLAHSSEGDLDVESTAIMAGTAFRLELRQPGADEE